MTREQGYQLLTKYLTNPNLIKHSLAAEATMRALCRQLNHDLFADKTKTPQAQDMEEKWGLTGLLHDADYELSKDMPEKHGLLLFEKEPTAFPQDIMYAIKAHNYENTKLMPATHMDWAIACCDQLTGLIVAAALVHPEKKLEPLTIDFILKRFNEKSFARGADRNAIKLCEDRLGIPLNEFIAITLNAMKQIHDQLGL